jgi:hypothetical protein
VTLDAYKKTLARLVDFEDKVVSNSELDWVTAPANTHAKFVQDISSPTSTRPRAYQVDLRRCAFRTAVKKWSSRKDHGDFRQTLWWPAGFD